MKGFGASGYGLQNLPYGAFIADRPPARLGVRYGDAVLDLRRLAEQGAFDALAVPRHVLTAPVLNALLEQGSGAWRALRARIVQLLERGDGADALVPLADVRLTLPFAVADFVDFYASEQHATNMGRIFRPDAAELPPAWRHLPIGYHGRAGSVVVSGTPVRRPRGQRAGGAGGPVSGPSQALDFELELGFVAGGPASAPGLPVPIARAHERIFGVVLVNDWSARDLQRWEYVPLGPFLGKSFATSISSWVVPLEALAGAMVPAPRQDPLPPDNLREERGWLLDLELEVRLHPAGAGAYRTICRTNARHLYWTFSQQLTHAASNGAVVRPGDLYASGTISGDTDGSYGSLIELTWNGERPLELDGHRRVFLEDGDSVVLTATTRDRMVALGEVEGTVLPAPPESTPGATTGEPAAAR